MSAEVPESPDEPIHDDRPLLRVLSEEHGDPDLFPVEVHRLHEAGQGRRARKVLRKALGETPPGPRADLQRVLLDEARIWIDPVAKAPSMYTVNGIGTRLVGKHQPQDDGTHVGVIWFCLFFLPLIPLGAWLVAPGEERGSYYFLGRAPMPRTARVWGGVVGIALLALAAAGALAYVEGGQRTDVVAYNGFEEPVTVAVGDRSQRVRPRGHAVFEDVPTAPTIVETTVDRLEAPLEVLDVDLTGHGRKTVVYNVASRAFVYLEYVRWGEGDPPEGDLIGSDRIVILDRVDHVFTEPPEMRNVKEGGYIQDTVLSADPGSVDATARQWMEREDWEALDAVVRASLVLGTAGNDLVAAAPGLLGSGTETPTLEELRELRDTWPGSVELHRVYQGVAFMEDPEAVVAEYRRWLEAHPASGLAHYLLGRLVPDDEATDLYRRAVELQPGLPHSHRALGLGAYEAGDLVGARDHLERYAGFGARERVDALETRRRIAWQLGSPAAVWDELVDELADEEAPLDLLMIRYRPRLARDPGALDEALGELAAYFEADDELDDDHVYRRFIHGELALAAGDLPVVRDRVEGFLARDELDGIHWALPLRFALDPGATDADRATWLEAFRSRLGDDVYAHLVLLGACLAHRAGEADLAVAWRNAALGQAGLEEVRSIVEGAPSPESARALVEASGPLPETLGATLLYWAGAHWAGGRPDVGRSLLDAAYRIALPSELPYRRS